MVVARFEPRESRMFTKEKYIIANDLLSGEALSLWMIIQKSSL
jgi:hypothetical protein